MKEYHITPFEKAFCTVSPILAELLADRSRLTFMLAETQEVIILVRVIRFFFSSKSVAGLSLGAD